MREQKSIFYHTDWILISIYLILVLAGWFNIYAAVYNEEHRSIFNLSQSYGKQLIWICTSFLIALVLLMFDPKVFSAFAYLIYGIMVTLLVVVLFAGTEISGSKSWFQIGAFALQPAEFAKFATCLVIARYLSNINIRMEDLRTKFNTFIFLFIPVFLIFLQNDTGSAIVYFAFIFVMYREGLSGNILLIGVLIAVLFFMALLIDKIILTGILAGIALLFFYFVRKRRREVAVVIGVFLLVTAFVFSVDYAFDHFLEPHQKQRINVLIGKEVDLKGAGYNVNQSMIAVGSGGLLGKGFLNGTQTKYNFVPEQSTDFIFCTIGEEWGFAGSLVVIALFVGLMSRIVIVAERQRSAFSRIYGYGVASILFVHFMINIGMTIGLAPVIGIPLPFLSYGGSSLWAFTILLFIFIRMDSNRLQLI